MEACVAHRAALNIPHLRRLSREYEAHRCSTFPVSLSPYIGRVSDPPVFVKDAARSENEGAATSEPISTYAFGG